MLKLSCPYFGLDDLFGAFCLRLTYGVHRLILWIELVLRNSYKLGTLTAKY